MTMIENRPTGPMGKVADLVLELHEDAATTSAQLAKIIAVQNAEGWDSEKLANLWWDCKKEAGRVSACWAGLLKAIEEAKRETE